MNPWLVILFGSTVTGKLRHDSDIDIAVMCDAAPTTDSLYHTAHKISEVVGRESDLLDLSSLTTVMQFQVVSKGEVLYSNDYTRWAEYRIRIYKEYFLLNEERQVILDDIIKRGYILG